MNSLDKKELNTGTKSKLKRGKNSDILSVLIKKNSEKLDEHTAKMLIKSGNLDVLVTHLSNFKDLSEAVANELINNGYIDDLAKNLDRFRNLNKKIAKLLLKDWYGAVKNCLYSFIHLDNEVAYALVNAEDYYSLARSLDRFDNLDYEILLKLLINCPKGKSLLVSNRDVFFQGKGVDVDLLRSLKLSGRINEHKKLKEFYDAIKFEEIKENFESDNSFEDGFGILAAREAIKYGKGKYVIQFINQYKGDYRELIDLLIEGRYVDELKNSISKLRNHNLDRYELVSQFSITNNYNILIKNADKFEKKKITNFDIANEIIRNSDLDCRDSIKKLPDFSDEGEWEWINYCIDFHKIIKKGSREEFADLAEYFKSDFSPLPSNRKLPKKLKIFAEEKFGIHQMSKYKDLFE